MMSSTLVGILFFAVFILLGGLLAAGCVFYRRISTKMTTLEQRHDKLQQQLRLLLNADLFIEKRYSKLSQTLRDAEQHIATLEAKESADSSYKQAIKMAEMGADVDDLTTTCSLSEAEAKLLLHLKNYKAALVTG